MLVELDPDGGTIAGWRSANPDPGLKTLAAAGRHYLSPAMVVANCQELLSGLAVLLAPSSPDRTVAALLALTPVGLGEVLRGRGIRFPSRPCFSARWGWCVGYIIRLGLPKTFECVTDMFVM